MNWEKALIIARNTIIYVLWSVRFFVNFNCGQNANILVGKDIFQKKLHIVDLAKGPKSLRTMDTGMAVGVTADIEGRDDIILTGAKDGVTKFSLETGKHEYITKLWTESEGAEKVRRLVKEYQHRCGILDVTQTDSDQTMVLSTVQVASGSER